MSFTKLDCVLLKNSGSASDSSFCSLFNPQKKPGSMSFAASLAARDSIGGQVASKLAFEHFVEGMIDFFTMGLEPQNLYAVEREVEIVSAENLQAIEASFKRANSCVYSFGHKLAAGGRMAASLIGAVLQESIISVGRVGTPCAYLCRGSELYPFFEAASENGDSEAGATESYVGVASLVSVQLSSVHLEGADLLFFFSEPLAESHLSRFFRFVDERAGGTIFESKEVLERIFPRGLDMEFAAVVQVGPDTIFLDEEFI